MKCARTGVRLVTEKEFEKSKGTNKYEWVRVLGGRNNSGRKSNERRNNIRKSNKKLTTIKNNKKLTTIKNKLNKVVKYKVKYEVGLTRIVNNRTRVYTKDRVWRSNARVVAEKMLGRYLIKGEIVHHKDTNKLNDDPDNLHVYKCSRDHSIEHVRLNLENRKYSK